MESHCYNLDRRELAGMIYRPLVAVAGLAAVLHVVSAVGWLPGPRPSRTTDQTILVHQVDASRQERQVSFLFAGDSSCLMNVQTKPLSTLLKKRCLNLGTFSYLDLPAHGRLVEESVRANQDSIRCIVLLMHPEALRRTMPEDEAVAKFDRYLEGKTPPVPGGLQGRLHGWLGLHDIQSRFFDRLVPAPLPGAFGAMYRFSTHLERRMSQAHGHLADPKRKPFSGNAEYRLAANLPEKSRQFRRAVPDAVYLAVGITPVPESFAPPGYAATRDDMLRQWHDWLGADLALTNLPSTMRDEAFQSVTHLNESGAASYTQAIADILDSIRDLEDTR